MKSGIATGFVGTWISLVQKDTSTISLSKSMRRKITKEIWEQIKTAYVAGEVDYFEAFESDFAAPFLEIGDGIIERVPEFYQHI